MFTVVQACYDGDVRLIGGATSREGIVEICNGGAWGTVCENGWHVNDAKVVCRHLGYPVDEPAASKIHFDNIANAWLK